MLPVSDSVVELQDGRAVRRYLARERLGVVQTPQGFSRRLVDAAYSARRRVDFTDDGSVLRAVGKRVHVVDGEVANRKITTSTDVEDAVRQLGGGA